MWVLISTLSVSLYIKLDWDNTLQNYEIDFKKYKLENKAWNLQFRRTPSPTILWQYKYVNENTRKAFNKEEFKCLQDETSCTKEKRELLCKRLQSLPNIEDCKSLDYMQREFVALNQYMDSRIPPKKPTFKKYINAQQKQLKLYALIILLLPIFIFIFRKKLSPSK